MESIILNLYIMYCEKVDLTMYVLLKNIVIIGVLLSFGVLPVERAAAGSSASSAAGSSASTASAAPTKAADEKAVNAVIGAVAEELGNENKLPDDVFKNKNQDRVRLIKSANEIFGNLQKGKSDFSDNLFFEKDISVNSLVPTAWKLIDEKAPPEQRNKAFRLILDLYYAMYVLSDGTIWGGLTNNESRLSQLDAKNQELKEKEDRLNATYNLDKYHTDLKSKIGNSNYAAQNADNKPADVRIHLDMQLTVAARSEKEVDKKENIVNLLKNPSQDRLGNKIIIQKENSEGIDVTEIFKKYIDGQSIRQVVHHWITLNLESQGVPSPFTPPDTWQIWPAGAVPSVAFNPLDKHHHQRHWLASGVLFSGGDSIPYDEALATYHNYAFFQRPNHHSSVTLAMLRGYGTLNEIFNDDDCALEENTSLRKLNVTVNDHQFTGKDKDKDKINNLRFFYQNKAKRFEKMFEGLHFSVLANPLVPVKNHVFREPPDNYLVANTVAKMAKAHMALDDAIAIVSQMQRELGGHKSVPLSMIPQMLSAAQTGVQAHQVKIPFSKVKEGMEKFYLDAKHGRIPEAFDVIALRPLAETIDETEKQFQAAVDRGTHYRERINDILNYMAKENRKSSVCTSQQQGGCINSLRRFWGIFLRTSRNSGQETKANPPNFLTKVKNDPDQVIYTIPAQILLEAVKVLDFIKPEEWDAMEEITTIAAKDNDPATLVLLAGVHAIKDKQKQNRFDIKDINDIIDKMEKKAASLGNIEDVQKIMAAVKAYQKDDQQAPQASQRRKELIKEAIKALYHVQSASHYMSIQEKYPMREWLDMLYRRVKIVYEIAAGHQGAGGIDLNTKNITMNSLDLLGQDGYRLLNSVKQEENNSENEEKEKKEKQELKRAAQIDLEDMANASDIPAITRVYYFKKIKEPSNMGNVIGDHSTSFKKRFGYDSIIEDITHVTTGSTSFSLKRIQVQAHMNYLEDGVGSVWDALMEWDQKYPIKSEDVNTFWRDLNDQVLTHENRRGAEHNVLTGNNFKDIADHNMIRTSLIWTKRKAEEVRDLFYNLAFEQNNHHAHSFYQNDPQNAESYPASDEKGHPDSHIDKISNNRINVSAPERAEAAEEEGAAAEGVDAVPAEATPYAIEDVYRNLDLYILEQRVINGQPIPDHALASPAALQRYLRLTPKRAHQLQALEAVGEEAVAITQTPQHIIDLHKRLSQLHHAKLLTTNDDRKAYRESKKELEEKIKSKGDYKSKVLLDALDELAAGRGSLEDDVLAGGDSFLTQERKQKITNLHINARKMKFNALHFPLPLENPTNNVALQKENKKEILKDINEAFDLIIEIKDILRNTGVASPGDAVRVAAREYTRQALTSFVAANPDPDPADAAAYFKNNRGAPQQRNYGVWGNPQVNQENLNRNGDARQAFIITIMGHVAEKYLSVDEGEENAGAAVVPEDLFSPVQGKVAGEIVYDVMHHGLKVDKAQILCNSFGNLPAGDNPVEVSQQDKDFSSSSAHAVRRISQYAYRGDGEKIADNYRRAILSIIAAETAAAYARDELHLSEEDVDRIRRADIAVNINEDDEDDDDVEFVEHCFDPVQDLLPEADQAKIQADVREIYQALIQAPLADGHLNLLEYLNQNLNGRNQHDLRDAEGPDYQLYRKLALQGAMTGHQWKMKMDPAPATFRDRQIAWAKGFMAGVTTWREPVDANAEAVAAAAVLHQTELARKIAGLDLAAAPAGDGAAPAPAPLPRHVVAIAADITRQKPVFRTLSEIVDRYMVHLRQVPGLGNAAHHLGAANARNLIANAQRELGWNLNDPAAVPIDTIQAFVAHVANIAPRKIFVRAWHAFTMTQEMIGHWEQAQMGTLDVDLDRNNVYEVHYTNIRGWYKRNDVTPFRDYTLQVERKSVDKEREFTGKIAEFKVKVNAIQRQAAQRAENP